MGTSCPFCQGQALHAGDVVALDPNIEASLRATLMRLARDRGLRIVAAEGKEPAALTVVGSTDTDRNRSAQADLRLPAVVNVRQAQRLLHHVCLQGAGQHGGTAPYRRSSPGDGAATDVIVLPPTVTGQPHRGLFDQPWHRDALVWVGLGLMTLGPAAAPVVLLRTLGPSWTNDPFLIRLDLPPWGLATLMSLGLAGLAWCLIVLPGATVRRTWRRAKDRDLLSVPPTDQLPGWRLDPLGQAKERWWNGLSWTGALQPPPRRHWLRLAPALVLAGAVVLLAWEATFALTRSIDTGTTVAPQPTASAALPSGYATLADALPQVERALLDYGNATGSDPMSDSSAAEAALQGLLAARNALDAALTNAPAQDQQFYSRFEQALEAFIAVRTQYLDELRGCGGQAEENQETCREQVRQEWQGAVQQTIQPLSDAYREILQPGITN